MNLQNRNSSLTNIFLLLLIAFTLLFHSNTTHAEDYSNNIGFMKNPPKELKEKFPMCDQFLDVKWIRQLPNGGWVGTVTANLYYGAKKEQRTLVVMQEQRGNAGISNLKKLEIFDVTDSRYQGRELEELMVSSDAVFSHLPAGDIGGHALIVEKDSKLIKILKKYGQYGKYGNSDSTLEDGLPKRSLTYFKKNICVILPKEVSGWLMETNRPFLSENLMSVADKTKLEQFKALAAKECSRPNNEIERGAKINDICALYTSGDSWLRQNLVLMDLDGDGLQDYGRGTAFFLNDNNPFVMKIPKQCYHSTYDYYDQHDMQREIRCTAEEKKHFLQNKNGGKR